MLRVSQTRGSDGLIEGVYRLIEELNHVFLNSLSYSDGVSEGEPNRGVRGSPKC